MKTKTIQFDQVLGNTSTDKRVEVLRAIHQSGSISEAARVNGVSYKAAWQAIETLSNLAGMPLLDKSVGGSGGGGAFLTPAGLQVLQAADLLAQAKAQTLAQLQGVSQGGANQVSSMMGIGIRTSMRNQLPATVSDIIQTPIGVRIVMALADGQLLCARITHESLELLGLKKKMPILALCKATAVTIAPTIVALGQVNLLKGYVSRVSRSKTDRQVSMALGPSIQLAGFLDPTVSVKNKQEVMAAIDESAVVIALGV